MSLSSKALLLAGAVLLTATAGARAQDYGYEDTAYATPPESVIVTAPPFREERNGLNAPSKVSLSEQVGYDDLNLSTREGARELRARVRDAALAVCRQLFDAYPIPQLPGTHCYRDAVHAGLVRADAAIRDARYEDRY